MAAQALGYVTVVTALLVYFGWSVTQTRYRYLGVPIELFDFRPDQLVLRCVGLLYRPVAYGGVALLVYHRLAPVVRRRARGLLSKRGVRLGCRASGFAVGALLSFVGAGATLLDWWRFSIQTYYVGPLYLTGGVLLMDRSLFGGQRLAVPVRLRVAVAKRIVVAAGAFWIIASYSVTVGYADGAQIASDLGGRPTIVVTARTNLEITGPGVAMRVVSAQAGQERYIYDGLQFFQRAGSRLVLLPARFEHGRSSAFVVQDSDVVSLTMNS